MKHFYLFSLMFYFLLMNPFSKVWGSITPKIEKKLEELEKEQERRYIYDQQRDDQLKRLREKADNFLDTKQYQRAFQAQGQILELLISYKGEEALAQANVLIETANQQDDPQLKLEAQLSKAEVLISLGIFLETEKILKNIAPHTLIKREYIVKYYTLKNRLSFDVAEYNEYEEYYWKYYEQGMIYGDSVLKYADEYSFTYLFTKASNFARRGKLDNAIAIYDRIIHEDKVTLHELAMTHASKSWLLEDNEARILELQQSAIYDIRSCTYEAISDQALAVLFFDRKELELADHFMQMALRNARQYGARQRISQINSFLPIIEAQIENLHQKKEMIWFSLIVILSIFISSLFLQTVRLNKRNRQIQSSQKLMKKQNLELETNNQQIKENQKLLNKKNEQLEEINIQLQNANSLREMYVKRFFEISAQFFEQLDYFHYTVGSLLVQKKYTKIDDLIKAFKPKKQRDLFYQNFDELFLDLYPTFIKDLEKITNDKGGFGSTKEKKLTPELRVFALMRLGISDTDRVANILGLTKNTIYAYRNRIKAKIPSDVKDFEEQLMNISSI
ncbi:DUF6377 domain-containing protein [Flammeovirga sp. OC4]|uniref:DUF6377 domain-containing protein n=1 Tax=Flammeovirga sp. OC4 TaxID=1382345 RepID=UPI0012E027FB|nr:DUF6377 domain-containing protein [Flammeovirga sp. OC4]